MMERNPFSWTLEAVIEEKEGRVYIGAVHIAATRAKILDCPKLSLNLLTTPDLCSFEHSHARNIISACKEEQVDSMVVCLTTRSSTLGNAPYSTGTENGPVS